MPEECSVNLCLAQATQLRAMGAALAFALLDCHLALEQLELILAQVVEWCSSEKIHAGRVLAK